MWEVCLGDTVSRRRMGFRLVLDVGYIGRLLLVECAKGIV